MPEDELFNTFDKTLYRQGSPVYKGDGTPLSDISTLQESNLGDGYSTGSTEMVNHALQSGTFLTGVRGWQIDAEGNAEFNNGTFRGTFILGGTLVTVTDIDELQTAIDNVYAQGGGTVSLVPGQYDANSSFIVPSGVDIQLNGSEVNLGRGAYQFLIQGSNAYSTGTVAVNFGSMNVVGTGTTWTAAMIDQYILIGDYWYIITGRTDNTHITIEYFSGPGDEGGNGFMGTSVSGASYVIATPVEGASISNGILAESSIPAIRFRYANGLNLEGLMIVSCSQAIDGDDSANVNLQDGFNINNCTLGITYDNVPFCVFKSGLISNIFGTALSLTGVTNTALDSLSIQAITGVGVKFTNCANFGFAAFSIIECTSHGIELASGNNDVDILSGYVNTCGGDGIKLTATSDRNTIVACSFLNNTGYGVNIAASSCDDNKVIAPAFSGNGSGTINDSGTGTFIAPQTFSSNVQTFNSSGTWNKPSSGSSAFIQCWGGGGSGGKGASGNAAGGGGGGSYTSRLISLSALGSTETVTVGAGGTAQTTNLTNGNAGGSTTFGAHLTAFGGAGGVGADKGGGGGGGGVMGVGTVGVTTTGGLGGSPSKSTLLGAGGAANNAGTYNTDGGGGGGGGGNGGSAGAGGLAVNGGGGGGGGQGSALQNTTGLGGNSLYGGGGGGGAAEDIGGAAGGTSTNGGNGGAGSYDTNAGTAGSQPGGGGGGSEAATSGAGGAGRVIVTTF